MNHGHLIPKNNPQPMVWLKDLEGRKGELIIMASHGVRDPGKVSSLMLQVIITRYIR